MISRKKSLSTGALAADLILLAAAFLLAAVEAQSTKVLESRSYMIYLLLFNGFVWYFSASSNGLYANVGSRMYISQAFSTVKCVFIQSVAAIIFLFVIKENLFTRNFILYYSALLFLFVAIRTIFFRKYLKSKMKDGANLRSLLIVGNGEIGQNFSRTVSSNPAFGYQRVTVVGNSTATDGRSTVDIKRLEEAINKSEFDEVVIALERSEESQIKEIIKICNKYALHTYFIPDYVRYLSRRFEFAMIGGFPILSLRREPLEELHWRSLKRLIDILLSLSVIVLLCSWLFPILALLQKFFSPGPVFYRQDRVGKYNKPFRCYKFRSMKISKTNDKFQPVVGEDSRITAFGKILRKSNLDELPQFFNVLKGDMSIVGPRPHAVSYDAVYEEFVEELRLRNLVKPGITGWAQIHGLRGDVPDDIENRKRIRTRIEYDVWYIENWSASLDIQIMLLTAWFILSGKTKRIPPFSA